MQVATHRGRKFDYVPRLDERNNNYLVRSITTNVPEWDRSRWWMGGPVLDQGREGACVGFGVTGEAMASPVRVSVGSSYHGAERVEAANQMALSVYNRAKRIDEFEGVDYDGTSVRAGLLVARERGWCKSFYWSKNLDEFRQQLDLGPIVIGIEWREGMYSTDPDGMVATTGAVIGGHCLLVTGYSPNYGGKFGPRFRLRNSWNLSYGKNGNGYATPDQIDDLVFKKGGEAGVVVGRGYGPVAA